jgi:hypothetical protein
MLGREEMGYSFHAKQIYYVNSIFLSFPSDIQVKERTTEAPGTPT